MTVAYVNAAAVVGTVSPNPINVPVPASPVAGNVFIVHAGGKPFGSTPAGPAGYTLLTSTTSGSVANADSTGSVRGGVFRYNVVGGESGTATFTLSSHSPFMGRMQQYSKDSAATWDIVGRTGSDTSETGTTVSATSTTVDVETGDMLAIGVFIKDDLPNHSSQSVTIAGATLSAVTWETKSAITSGNDGSLYIGRCSVTAGGVTAAIVYTATSSVSGASSTVVTYARLREILPASADRPRGRQGPINMRSSRVRSRAVYL